MDDHGHKNSDADGGREVFSKVMKAGKRTYFFDVKAMRDESLYITISESRKMRTREGETVYNKSKLFLYPEDFTRFEEQLAEVLAFVRCHGDADGGVRGKSLVEYQTVDEEFDAL